MQFCTVTEYGIRRWLSVWNVLDVVTCELPPTFSNITAIGPDGHLHGCLWCPEFPRLVHPFIHSLASALLGQGSSPSMVGLWSGRGGGGG